MSQFEDNLWESVVDEQGDQLARADLPRPSHRRPRMVAGATGTAACAAGLTLLLSATSSSPAFAVTRRPDGSVLVKIVRVSGVTGANRQLASMGVPAYLVAVSATTSAPTCRGARAVTVRAPHAVLLRAIPVPAGTTTTSHATTVLIPAPAATVAASPAPRTVTAAAAPVPPVVSTSSAPTVTAAAASVPPVVSARPRRVTRASVRPVIVRAGHSTTAAVPAPRAARRSVTVLAPHATRAAVAPARRAVTVSARPARIVACVVAPRR